MGIECALWWVDGDVLTRYSLPHIQGNIASKIYKPPRHYSSSKSGRQRPKCLRRCCTNTERGPSAGHYSKLRTHHHRILLRYIDFCREGSYRVLLWEDALNKGKCESLETRKLTLPIVGRLVCIDMPKRVMSLGRQIGFNSTV